MKSLISFVCVSLNSMVESYLRPSFIFFYFFEYIIRSLLVSAVIFGDVQLGQDQVLHKTSSTIMGDMKRHICELPSIGKAGHFLISPWNLCHISGLFVLFFLIIIFIYQSKKEGNFLLISKPVAIYFFLHHNLIFDKQIIVAMIWIRLVRKQIQKKKKCSRRICCRTWNRLLSRCFKKLFLWFMTILTFLITAHYCNWLW